ncbi:hypothetical protein ABEB36_003786 [Hypothenemus hampei]|uniref:Uncharacterized protein n=1 Tax=Hypothenemus hampei TaxID=57062 RepID=A0ABD1F2E3_HYPHA
MIFIAVSDRNVTSSNTSPGPVYVELLQNYPTNAPPEMFILIPTIYCMRRRCTKLTPSTFKKPLQKIKIMDGKYVSHVSPLAHGELRI